MPIYLKIFTILLFYATQPRRTQNSSQTKNLEVNARGSLHLVTLPVTLVPGPTLSAGFGPEVGAAEVHDAGGEAQEATVSVGPVHPGGGGGQTVLFISTGEEVERSILQVGCLLDELSIQDKVRSGCGGTSSRLIVKIREISVNNSHHVVLGPGDTAERSSRSPN